jgi:hypothetical protein
VATLALPVTFERPSGPRDLLLAKRGRVRFLAVPPMRHLAVDGSGMPGGDEFREAFGALYPVAYTLHFALKKRGVAAPVGGLEGLFRLDEPALETATDPAATGAAASDGADLGDSPPAGRDATGPTVTREDRPRAWAWRLLLPIPAEATDDDIAAAIADVAAKKAPPALPRLHVLAWEEGPAAQILHVGPYADEPPTIEALHAGIAAAGLRPRGLHHEIYLGDPNRSAPERLRTIIRQPVEMDA